LKCIHSSLRLLLLIGISISIAEDGESWESTVDYLQWIDLDHAFGFYDNIKNWTRSEEGYELFADIGEKTKFPGVNRAKINKVFHTPKQKMLLLFDYGDEWHFIVQYLGTIEVSPGQKLPMIMESNGEVPNQYGGFGDEEEYEDEDE
jgi:hypothetical protein